jgi:predicted deacylase
MLEIKHRIFKGEKPGPVLLVTARVHGTEHCGTKGIEEALDIIGESAPIKAGTLIVVPVVNEAAALENKRFIASDLNRAFNVYPEPEDTLSNEQRVANAMRRLYDYALGLAPSAGELIHIDLHSQGTPDSMPWGFIDSDTPEIRALLSALPVAYACTGWPELYADRNEPSSTDYLREKGAHTTTIECGGHDDPAAIAVARDSVLCALTCLGMIEPVYRVRRDNPLPIVHFDEIVPRAKGVDRVSFWRELDTVLEGTSIHKDSQGRVIKVADRDFVALFPTQREKIKPEKSDPEDFYEGHWVEGSREAIKAPVVTGPT